MADEDKPKMSEEERLNGQIQPFLDEWCYRILASPVGRMWTRQRAVTLLMDVFGMVGINIPADDRTGLLKSDDESLLVKAIINAMPGDIRDKFEATALQIQTVLHEATRILSASEAEGDEDVAILFDQCGGETGGLTQQVLKASVVFAAKEVSTLRRTHTSWRKNTDNRIDRLLKATEEAEHFQQQLLAAEAQLSQYKDTEKAKSKGLLMSMAEGQDSALVHSIFSTWLGYCEKVKAESGIRSKFEDQIKNIERKLFQFKESQIANVRGVIMRGAMQDDDAIMSFVWKTWVAEVNERKEDGDTAAMLKAVKDRMAAFESNQKEKAGQFMTRLAAGNDASLTNLCLEAWIKFHGDYAADKEMEDKVKSAEAAFKAHMANKKDDAKGVLNNMLAASDSGLLSLVMQNWAQFWRDEKKAKELEFALNEASDKFKSLNGRQKNGAKNVQNRVNEQMNLNIMQRVFNCWIVETKSNRVESHYNAKYDTKKKQLQGIQQLFKSFAMQLEQNLGQDDDSSSRTGRRSKHGKKMDRASEGSVSLPDIHQKGVAC